MTIYKSQKIHQKYKFGNVQDIHLDGQMMILKFGNCKSTKGNTYLFLIFQKKKLTLIMIKTLGQQE